MKSIVYIIASVFLLTSCYSSRSLSSSMEDDIYYVPGAKPLIVKEVETETGQHIDMTKSAGTTSYTQPESDWTGSTASVINRRKGTVEQVNTADLAYQAESQLSSANDINETIYENTGYWIGGFKGSESDLREAARIIAQYPQGFGYIANGTDIALSLSVSPDWNVYTDNNRYWWFPSSSNIELYSTFLFGSYPKYIWTIAWNQPGYDSFVFDRQFNWSFNLGWGNPGWSFGFGWNNGWYDPWYRPWYNGWYGWGGWYDPWYPGGYYPHWHHHYPYPPIWGGGHYPPSHNRPAPVRPDNNLRPGIGTRPGYATRPGNNTRPGYGTRPGTNVRPGTTTRPGMTRPGTSVRPGTTTRPATTRPSTSGQSNRYTRPATRPGSNSYNYNRNNTTRPSYNNTRSGGSSYSPSRSTGTTRSSGTTRSGGGSTRTGGRR